MTRRVTVAERRARLARRHRLVPSHRVDDVAAITDSMVGLHSSDPATVYLSATARMKRPSIAAVADALYEHRSVLRHHAMRRTLWVFTPQVARLAHAACTAALAPPEWTRLAKMVEDSEVASDGAAWVAAAKRDTLAALHRAGEATTRQLGQLVPALRAPLHLAVGKAYAGQQGAHTRVLLNLGFDGLIVRGRSTGSWISSEYTWSPTDRWLPGGVVGADPVAAADELTRRYLAAFGPASTADVQWWMGWTLGATKRALASISAVEVELDDGPAWVRADDTDPEVAVKPWIAFLPGLDSTTMGWKERAWYVGDHGGLGHSLFDRNGNGGPTVWVDGEIVGGWAQRQSGEIAHRLLKDIGRARADAVAREAERLRALIGAARVNARFPAPIQKELLA